MVLLAYEVKKGQILKHVQDPILKQPDRWVTVKRAEREHPGRGRVYLTFREIGGRWPFQPTWGFQLKGFI